MSKSNTSKIFTKMYEDYNNINCKRENNLIKMLNNNLIEDTNIVEVTFPSPPSTNETTINRDASTIPQATQSPTVTTFEQTFINLENTINKKVQEMNMSIRYTFLKESNSKVNVISTIAFSCREAARNYADNIMNEQLKFNNTPGFAAACRSEKANETLALTNKVNLKKNLNDDNINGYFTGFISSKDYNGETEPKDGINYSSYEIMDDKLKKTTGESTNNKIANVYYSNTIDPLIDYLSKSPSISMCKNSDTFYTTISIDNSPSYTPDNQNEPNSGGSVTIPDEGHAQLKRTFKYLNTTDDPNSPVKVHKKIYFVGFAFNPSLFSDSKESTIINNKNFSFANLGKNTGNDICNKYNITNKFPIYSCPPQKEGFTSNSNELLGDLAESINNDVLDFQKNYSKFTDKQLKHIHLAKKFYGDVNDKYSDEENKISTHKRKAQIARYNMKRTLAIKNIIIIATIGMSIYIITMLLQNKTALGSIIPDFMFSGLYAMVIIITMYLLITKLYDFSNRSKFNFDDIDTKTFNDYNKNTMFNNNISGEFDIPENIDITISKGNMPLKEWNNYLKRYNKIKDPKIFLNENQMQLPKKSKVTINKNIL